MSVVTMIGICVGVWNCSNRLVTASNHSPPGQGIRMLFFPWQPKVARVSLIGI